MQGSDTMDVGLPVTSADYEARPITADEYAACFNGSLGEPIHRRVLAALRGREAMLDAANQADDLRRDAVALAAAARAANAHLARVLVRP